MCVFFKCMFGLFGDNTISAAAWKKKNNEMTFAPSEDSDQPGPPASCCCLFGFNVAFNNFLVICCDRELNVHFYSAASLKYHAPYTRHDTTPSHIILTLGRPDLALPRKSWVPSEEQLVPFLTTLVCRGQGSNPWPPIPRSGHAAYRATGAYRPVLSESSLCTLRKTKDPILLHADSEDSDQTGRRTKLI